MVPASQRRASSSEQCSASVHTDHAWVNIITGILSTALLSLLVPVHCVQTVIPLVGEAAKFSPTWPLPADANDQIGVISGDIDAVSCDDSLINLLHHHSGSLDALKLPTIKNELTNCCRHDIMIWPFLIISKWHHQCYAGVPGETYKFLPTTTQGVVQMQLLILCFVLFLLLACGGGLPSISLHFLWDVKCRLGVCVM